MNDPGAIGWPNPQTKTPQGWQWPQGLRQSTAEQITWPSRMDGLWQVAGTFPSLDINFAANKSLVDSFSGRNLITFSRGSSGTFFDANGVMQIAPTNTPRFDHNPTTGESLGLLVEEQRSNLLVWSEEFDKASWVALGGSVATNNVVAPSGLSTADTWTTTAGQTATLHQVVSCAASTTYTWSFWARMGTLPVADFRFAVRDDSNGAFIAEDIIPSVTPVTTEWRRISYMFTTPAGCVLVRPYLIRFASSSGGTIHFWGAQLEAGAFPTSYIPTTGSAATRAADVASITGTSFSSWYRQDEGTVFAHAINPAISTTVFTISDGSINNRIAMDSGTNSRIARVVSSGVLQASSNLPYAYGASQGFAMSYRCNSINFANAGALGTEDTSASIPGVNRITIGTNPAGGAALNSCIRRLTYWPTLLPDSTLQALTR